MSEQIVAGLFGLAAALVAGTFGYVQWRRTQTHNDLLERGRAQAEGQSAYRDQRVKALSQLWNEIHDVDEYQRSGMKRHGRDSQPLPQNQFRQINLVLNRSRPFLLDDEHAWATEMVAGIMDIDQAIRDAAQRGEPGTEWWGDTGRQPPEGATGAMAARRLDDASNLLAQRLAEVVEGKHR